jgi:hypothetical protein
MLDHPFELAAVEFFDIVERVIVSDKSAGPGAAGLGTFNVA